MKKLYTLIFLTILFAGGLQAQTFTGIDINPSGDSYPTYMIEYNGLLYFSAYDGTHGSELWVTDGTPSGTHLVKDINPGVGNLNFGNPIVLNGKLYFLGYDGAAIKLFVSDGTAAGTYSMGASLQQAQGMTAYNGKLYFNGTDGTHGNELWVSDGTEAGTQMLIDINTGAHGSLPSDFIIMGGKLYFSAGTDATLRELWVTDGTAANTQMIKDIYPGATSCDFYFPVVLGNKMYFTANDGTNGNEVWVTDGSTANTKMLVDIQPGAQGSYPTELTVYDGKIYFAADNGNDGKELWVSDGTLGGTQMLKNIYPGSSSSNPNFLHVYNGKLYFTATDGTNGYELWVSDGSTSGTKMFKDLIPGSGGAAPRASTIYHNKMYFTADVTTNDHQLWVSDGTDTGTYMIQPTVAPNTAPVADGFNEEFCVYHDKLFFSAKYNNIGAELWVYNDGTVGIDETVTNNNVSIYPNPFNNHVTVTGLDANENYTVRLTDIAGREIFSRKTLPSGNQLHLDMPSLSSGIYLLQVQDNKQVVTHKLVRE